MIFKNLNNRFNYTLQGKTYEPTAEELVLITKETITKNDWKNKDYKRYKDKVKQRHFLYQNDRCAYCRTKRMNIDAYYNHIEHIIPQTEIEKWIFRPKNLIVACTACNSLKNADITLADITVTEFPDNSNGFKIFNPHFDNWSDHFHIKDGIFLTGKEGSKGYATIEYCHLFRYHVALDYADEMRYRRKKTFRRLTHKLNDCKVGSREHEQLNLAIDSILLRINM